MKPEESLISEVKQFLKTKHNVVMSIPTLHNLIDSKVNLKIVKPQTSSSITHGLDQTHENRYKIIIQQIQALLSSSNFDMHAIQSFMSLFNRTINTDIQILQKNQVIRANSFRIKQKLIFRINEISKKTHLLISTCQKIHDKDDIITFIAIDMKNYLMSIKLIAEEYEQAKTVEINTPLKIDEIYQYEYSSEEHYHDHYEPLLEVLVRLKANMNNLEQDVKSSTRIDMPLKSVNLLANCKNLLLELEPFLITNQCAFNRLIFHVVTQQSQNIKLISGFYKKHLDFVRSLVYNLFKCVYLGHLFVGKYTELKNQIADEKKKIIDQIKKIDIGLKLQQYMQISKILTVEQKKHLSKINQKIKYIKKIICYGHSNVISEYVEQKLCKKLKLLLEQKQQVQNLLSLLGDGDKYLSEVKKLEQEEKQLSALKIKIIKNIEIINSHTRNKINQINKSKGLPPILSDEQKEKLFRADMIMIQQKNIKLSAIESKIRQYEKLCREVKLVQEYFPRLYEIIKRAKQDYMDLQTKLLNSYQHLLEEREEKQAQAIQRSEKAIKEITGYIMNQSKLDGFAYSSIGGQILNEDEHCHKVKDLLGLIDSAEYLLKQTQSKNVKSKNEEQIKRLQKYRKFLQWFLCLFESSMDESILQSIIDKMDFNEGSQQIINKSISKGNELLTQVHKYLKQMKKIMIQVQYRNKQSDEKDKQIQRVYQYAYNKILRIVKQRTLLYQVIDTLYTECLSIYSELKGTVKGKRVQLYDIEAKGVKLFDSRFHKNVVLYYHCLNKIQVINKLLKDANLNPKTQNYIFDDILQPFQNRLASFVKFNQNQMLQLAIRLQKAIQIEKNYKLIIKNWEQTVQKGKKKEQSDIQYKQRIRQSSKQLIEMEQQIIKIEQLGNKKFVVLNIEQVKKIHTQCDQYIDASKQIIKSEDLAAVCAQKNYKNAKLTQILRIINKNFQKK